MGVGFAVPKKPAGWHRVRAAGFNKVQNGWGCRQHLVEVEISSSHGLQPQTPSRRADCICWSGLPGTVFKVAIRSLSEAPHVVFVAGRDKFNLEVHPKFKLSSQPRASTDAVGEPCM